MTPFNPSFQPSPQWQNPSGYSPYTPSFIPSFSPPSSFNFQNPFPSSNGGSLVGRTAPLPPSGITPSALSIPSLPKGPIPSMSPPSFATNPLSGRTQPLNYPTPTFPNPQNFSLPSFQPSFSSYPNSFASFKLPPFDPSSQISPPLSGRTDVAPSLTGLTYFQDFRVTLPSSHLSGTSWMPPSYSPGTFSFPFNALLPFPSDRQTTTSLGKDIGISPFRLKPFPSFLTPEAEARVNCFFRNKLEQTMKATYSRSAPPPLPLPMMGWMPMVFQVDPQTTLFFDPIAFNDFFQRATPAEKRVAQVQLTQLIKKGERTNDQSLSISDFSLGFAQGLPKGMYDSGRGLLTFVSDVATHPIRTGQQMKESFQLLGDLARSGQWEVMSKALAPEIHQLVREWNSLSSRRQGELAGYILGRYGADIFIPGAVAKAVSQGVKGAQKFNTVYRGLKTAEQTLLLESAAELGSGAKIGEFFQAHRRTFTLGKELGFSTSEMVQLKQAGQLEGTVAHAFENIVKNPAMHQSFELFEKAQSFLNPYKEFMPETKCRELIRQAGVQTFPKSGGIPENFRVRISDKGAGMEYVHPTNTHLRVRVMPGKPHSPFPYQQKPYVIQMESGKAIDKFGNKIDKKSFEAHIPIDEFIYRKN